MGSSREHPPNSMSPISFLTLDYVPSTLNTSRDGATQKDCELEIFSEITKQGQLKKKRSEESLLEKLNEKLTGEGSLSFEKKNSSRCSSTMSLAGIEENEEDEEDEKDNDHNYNPISQSLPPTRMGFTFLSTPVPELSITMDNGESSHTRLTASSSLDKSDFDWDQDSGKPRLFTRSASLTIPEIRLNEETT